MVTLYSTGCPKCNVLKKKLYQKEVNYDEINDVEIISQKGFSIVPVLEVNGKYMNFKEAVDWINKYKGDQLWK